MREIKFRLWSDSLKVMYSPDNQIGYLWSIPEADNGVIKVKGDEILMQFTGLRDMNGKEIYEGDILKGVGEINNYRVVYEECEFVLYHKYGRWGLLSLFPEIILTYKQEVEIIGNIYENPDLL